MKTKVTEISCVVCDHEILEGVAFDWRPEGCPFAKHAENQNDLASHDYAFWASKLGLSNEYDAVRSEN